MRVGLFGGSFDPPHRGHLLVAEAARHGYGLHRVFLAPVARQPLKLTGASAKYEQRLRMTELLCGLDRSGSLQASDVDAPQPDGSPNYTVDTLSRLRAGLPHAGELFLITGADAFLDLRRWHRPERLLELAEWIVVSRPGVAEAQIEDLGLTKAQRARVHWLGGVQDPVSATDVRHRLAAGLPCDDLVPEPVLEYIREHGLYRANEP